MSRTDAAVPLALFCASTMALPLIQALVQQQRLVGVVTPARGEADLAHLRQGVAELGLPLFGYQPDKPELCGHQLEQWQAELGLIFTFPHILPKSLMGSMRRGLFNLHGAPLPRYRGPAPLFWQLRNGETETALCIHRVTEGPDSGPLQLSLPIPIHPNDTLNSLGAEMAARAPHLAMEFLSRLSAGKLKEAAQTESPTWAPSPGPEALTVRWGEMTAREIGQLARAANSQFGGALLRWRQAQLGLLQASPVDRDNYGLAPGTVLYVGEPLGLVVATTDGALRLEVLHLPEGIFTGMAFAERFQLDAGMAFD